MTTLFIIYFKGFLDMATLTIRNLDNSVKTNLRVNAAKHGCSIEEEARRILARALSPQKNKKNLGTRIHQHFHKSGGVDLEQASRSTPRSAPDFSSNE